MEVAITHMRQWLVFGCISGILAPYASGQTPSSGQETIQQPMIAAATIDPDRPHLSERNPRYRINRSDVLNLAFALSPEFNQTVTVQPDGYITLQGAGSVCILGMTVPETSEAIKKAYAKVLHEPIVDVDLKDFQRAYFIVTGQVTKPGQYDLRYDLTASQAIAIAGGFMPTAKTQVFLYHRSSDGWVQARELKLKDFLHGK